MGDQFVDGRIILKLIINIGRSPKWPLPIGVSHQHSACISNISPTRDSNIDCDVSRSFKVCKKHPVAG